jgi:hypothetical protein
MQCPHCGQEVTEIMATHEYAIRFNHIWSRWVKDNGEVTYRHYASGCMEALDTSEIADILKQVDEL